MASVSRQRPSKIVSDAIDALDLGTASTLTQEEVVLESERNAANGFAGISAGGTIEASVSIRQGTTAELGSLVPADGELICIKDTSGNPAEMRIGDGTTVLGIPFPSGRKIVLADTIVLADSTTYADVPGFNFIAQPGEIYEVTLFLYWSTSDDGIKFQFDLGSNSAMLDTRSDVIGDGFFGQLQHWEYQWMPPASASYGDPVHSVFSLRAFISGNTPDVDLQLQAAKMAATGEVVGIASLATIMLVKRLF